MDFYTRVTDLIDMKWILLLISPVIFYFIKFVLNLAIKGIRAKIHANLKYEENTFAKNFSKLYFENALSWSITCILWAFYIENLGLSEKAEKNIFIVLKVIFAIYALKLATMVTEALTLLLTDIHQQRSHPLDRQITPLISKSLKIFVVIMGVLILLQNLGVNVTALIAGLGLGGVAIAFAAQNTISNLFGTITILLDTPFKIGNKVRINTTEGVVETIGFRSTRLRTATNTLVSIPNSIVASVQVDNLSEINARYRFSTVLKFQQNSPTEKLKQFSDELSYFLKQETHVVQSSISVHFSEITEFSKNITVVFQYNLDEKETENKTREFYFYEIEKIVETVGLNYAQPPSSQQFSQSP